MSARTGVNEDPFHVVSSELESQLKATRVKFDAWRVQVDAVDTSLDLSFKQRSAEVRLDIKKVSDLCNKIYSTVTNAQQNREMFPHIDDREMALRQSIVDRLNGLATKLRADLNSPAIQGKISSDERRALARRTNEKEESRPHTAFSAGNAAHLAGARSEQQVVLKQQDQALDKMSAGLDTLHEMANVIDSELKDQDKILEDIDAQTDSAQGKMDQAIAHIEKLIGKPGCCSGNSCQL